MRRNAMISVLPIFLIFHAVESGSVLITTTSLFPVHRYTMRYLAEELLKRGHQVTWFEYGLIKPKISLPKSVREEFVVVSTRNKNINDLYLFRNHSAHSLVWLPTFDDPLQQTDAWLASLQLCDEVLSIHRAKFDALVNEHFDTVVVDDLYNPCGLLFVGLRKTPFIYWSITALRTESAWANQSPSPPSYIPVHGTGFTDEMGFWERFYNAATYLRVIFVHQHLILRRMDKLFQKYYPGRLTESFYIERNASVNFVNTPPIFDFARPYMPRVNFVGGLHCRRARPLQGALAEFVAKANTAHGVILISGGFSVQWDKAPTHILKAFLSVFKRKQGIRFIWQYNGRKLTELPANVYTSSWLPQQDILGHPKTRAHISHGGLNSLIESMWHGVPVIGFPLTAEAYDSLLRITSRNAGIMLKKEMFDETSLENAINQIYDKRFIEEVSVFRDLVTDVPYTELNHSAFWAEFILRHQEVPYSRSGADLLNIFQYFLIDVIAFLLSVCIASLYVCLLTIKFSLRFLRYFVKELLLRSISWRILFKKKKQH